MYQPATGLLALVDRLIGMAEAKKLSAQRQLDALRTIREAAADLLPEMQGAFIDSLRAMLSPPLAPVHKAGVEKPEKAAAKGPGSTLTHYERIGKFFVDRTNEPATNQMIRSEVQLTRSAIAMVLYSSHAGDFERVAKLGTKTYWKLKDSVYRYFWFIFGEIKDEETHTG